MIDADNQISQIKLFIIRPALTAMGAYSPALENLIAGIGNVESGYKYISQLGAGPARGDWQMEPFTHDDCWQNYLRYPRQSKMATAIRAMMVPGYSATDQLRWNRMYAAAMCAVKCLRATPLSPIPNADDAAGQAQFWKKYYNTGEGSGSALGSIHAFQAAINA